MTRVGHDVPEIAQLLGDVFEIVAASVIEVFCIAREHGLEVLSLQEPPVGELRSPIMITRDVDECGFGGKVDLVEVPNTIVRLGFASHVDGLSHPHVEVLGLDVELLPMNLVLVLCRE